MVRDEEVRSLMLSGMDALVYAMRLVHPECQREHMVALAQVEAAHAKKH